MFSGSVLGKIADHESVGKNFSEIMSNLLLQSGDDIDSWSDQNSNMVLILELAKSLNSQVAEGQASAVNTLHEVLNRLYSLDFEIPKDSQSGPHSSYTLRAIQSILEKGAMDHLENTVTNLEVSIPRKLSGSEAVKIIKDVIHAHGAFDHPYYKTTLREHANIEDLKYYFAQEITVDPRFDDLIANLQVGLRGIAKMELAHNYWDEMGNGEPSEVHTDLFKRATDALGICEKSLGQNLSFESILCGNVSVLLACRRDNFYRGAGYFGAMEYLVPIRMDHVLHCWKRNKLPSDAIRYHEVHMSVDEQHSEGWFKNVIEKAVDENPACFAEILEGVIWRLETSMWYLDMLESRSSALTA
ncbi:iron-containing redox enzyme family protein [Teredinibacter waterburyi]|uniref:iron-containing redox enzyme family protein n=1 Tax=Teredinibacter waterburyi TaxID=1500538 RepID=UPI00165F9FD4|nr:iron-containing redox enzyme family protein [Teredinibacter waterburyi]